MQYRTSDQDLVRVFRHAGIPIEIHNDSIVKGPVKHLRYVEIRTRPRPQAMLPTVNVLLIHGAPSSLRVWMDYLLDTALIAQANLYAVDRPGYGYSDFGIADTSILSQAIALEPILDSRPGPWVVFGSSYGGPIGTVLSALRPDKVKGMLLTSPSLAPGEEKIYPISYTVENPIFGWWFPAIFRVANAEKLSHRHALERIVQFYPEVHVPVTYIHGGQDSLIYITNAAYAKKTFTGTQVKFILLKNRPHFFTFSEQPLVTRELVGLVQRVSKE